MMNPDVPPVITIIPAEGGIVNDTAPSSSNNLPASARPRPARPQPDRLLSLHDPYETGLSLTDFGDLVRHSLAIGPDSPTSEINQEAGQVPTKRPRRSFRRTAGKWLDFIFKLISPIFFWFQMGLPSVYFRRVALIIRKSEISMADFASIKRRGTSQGMLGMITLAGGVCLPNINKIHSMKRFKKKWKSFVMRCIEEWGILNVISSLLLGILLTFLQIEEAGLHPITRLTALLSLECAFMSLLYSVLYLARFHSLRDVERGMNWIFAATQTSTRPYWNLWLFLALPTVWLAWSLIFFSTSLLSFVWTSGDRRVPELTPSTDEDQTMGFMPMSFRDFTPLWPRIILTVVFTFGLSVGFLVMRAFKEVGANKWEAPKTKKYSSDSTSTTEDDEKVVDVKIRAG